jgi:uncharacterized protein YndB with AHSA1/START domain
MDKAFSDIPPECEIVSTRVINAPRHLVFRAWTDPSLLQQWWGPAGFTNTFREFDLRVGGRWRFTMHGPEKGNYENECVFLRIDEPHLLAWDRISKPLFRVVVSFEEAGADRTNLTFRMQFSSEAECAKIRKYAPSKNEENFDKLEAVLGV